MIRRVSPRACVIFRIPVRGDHGPRDFLLLFPAEGFTDKVTVQPLSEAACVPGHVFGVGAVWPAVEDKSAEKQAFAVCGGRSGRDLDKFTAAPLTAVEAEKVLPCAIREFPLTLECRVIYRETEETAKLPEEIRKRFYSVETEAHTAYYGQIVSAYLLEED